MKIENYRELSPIGPVIGTFDVYLPGMQMTIYGCKVIRSKKTGRLFHTLPTYAVDGPDGTKKFAPVISFSAEKQAEFDKLLRRELEPFITNR